jgi:hypothetical protein
MKVNPVKVRLTLRRKEKESSKERGELVSVKTVIIRFSNGFLDSISTIVFSLSHEIKPSTKKNAFGLAKKHN